MATHSLYVRDVPEDIHSTLRVRAAAAGMSMSAYILKLLRDEVHQPTVTEVFSRRRQPVTLTDDEIVAAIHEGRR